MKWCGVIIPLALISCYGLYEVTAKDSGDACEIAGTGVNGTWRIEADCPKIMDDYAQSKQFPTPCGFVDDQQIICCPNAYGAPTKPPGTNRISALKCVDYQKMFFVNATVQSPIVEGAHIIVPATAKCGISRTFIIRGSQAYPREFPHMAAIGYQPEANDEIRYECSGSLISENFVLTAAHCVTSRTARNSVKYVLLGVYDLNNIDCKDDSQSVRLRVAKEIVHHEYNKITRLNDIGLLQLERNIEFSEYIRPACLAETFQDADDNRYNTLKAINWGDYSYRTLIDSVLLMLISKPITPEDCAKAYPRSASNDELHFCARSYSDERDATCEWQGGTGGPILIEHRTQYCMYIIVGITSIPKACHGPNSGLYTRLFAYLDWIESHVWLDHSHK